MCRAIKKNGLECTLVDSFDGFCAKHYSTFRAFQLNKSFTFLKFIGTINQKKTRYCDFHDSDDQEGLFYQMEVGFGCNTTIITVCKRCYNNHPQIKDCRWNEDNNPKG